MMAKVIRSVVFVAFLSLTIALQGRAAFLRFPALNVNVEDAKLIQHRLKLPRTTQAFLQSENYAISRQMLRNERQTACTPDSTELDQRIAALRCDANYVRAVNEAEGIECSLLSGVLFAFNQLFADCGVDRRGTFCVEHENADKDPGIIARDVIRECFEDPRNCSNKCKMMLENFSERFGCCVHSNDVTRSSELIRALTPQLWDNCGVALPNPCENAPVVTQTNGNLSCSYTCSLNQFHALYCKYQAKKAMEIYRECGDEQSALGVAQSCGFNHKGEFCATVGNRHSIFFIYRNPRDELDDEYFLDVYSKCIEFSSTGICPTECREALLEAKQNFGCCFNNLNTTAFNRNKLFSVSRDGLRNFVTSYNLWSACVVEPPGLCEFPADTSVYDKLTQCGVCDLHDDAAGDFPLLAVAVSAVGVLLLLTASIPVIVFCCCRKRHTRKVTSGQGVKPPPTVVYTKPAPDPTPPTPDSTPPTPDHTEVTGQPAADYYDYIRPLDALPQTRAAPSPHAPPPQTAVINTVEADGNMTPNSAYNLIPSGDRDRREDTNSTSPYYVPLPPPSNRGNAHGNSRALKTEDYAAESHITMVRNPASDTLSPQRRNEQSVQPEEEVVLYI